MRDSSAKIEGGGRNDGWAARGGGREEAFRELFGSAPPPEYNLLKDDLLERQGFLELVRRAIAGEHVRVPPHWYDPRELRQLEVREGRRVGVEVTVVPLRDASGAVAHLALCFHDVTAELQLRERTEELKQSQERFGSAFEQAAVGMAHVAPNGRWLEVNQRLCEIVGYSRDELLAITFQDITFPPDLDGDLELVQQMLAGRINSYTLEKRYVRKGGELVWIELTVSLVREPTGEPRYFISVVQDIHARKTAEADLRRARRALAEREEQLATTLDSIGDGVISTDSHGLIARMNRVAERLTGWPIDDARTVYRTGPPSANRLLWPRSGSPWASSGAARPARGPTPSPLPGLGFPVLFHLSFRWSWAIHVTAPTSPPVGAGQWRRHWSFRARAIR